MLHHTGNQRPKSVGFGSANNGRAGTLVCRISAAAGIDHAAAVFKYGHRDLSGTFPVLANAHLHRPIGSNANVFGCARNCAAPNQAQPTGCHQIALCIAFKGAVAGVAGGAVRHLHPKETGAEDGQVCGVAALHHWSERIGEAGVRSHRGSAVRPVHQAGRHFIKKVLLKICARSDEAGRIQISQIVCGHIHFKLARHHAHGVGVQNAMRGKWHGVSSPAANSMRATRDPNRLPRGRPPGLPSAIRAAQLHRRAQL